MKRTQIFYDLVVHKNWSLFTQLVQSEVASIVAQQIQRQSTTNKTNPTRVMEVEKNLTGWPKVQAQVDRRIAMMQEQTVEVVPEKQYD